MRAYFECDKDKFDNLSDEHILGMLAKAHEHDLVQDQTYAWVNQLPALRRGLKKLQSYRLLLEYSIPRMGKRIDAIVLLENSIFVLEFKSDNKFSAEAKEQVEDYALDIKNFHAKSHNLPIFPILIAMGAEKSLPFQLELALDLVAKPICISLLDIDSTISEIARSTSGREIDFDEWVSGGYKPTPTIIEAAKLLYSRHGVDNLKHFDAGADNLEITENFINEIINQSKAKGEKSICFLTGVPGAGKTLAGLNIASTRANAKGDEHAVFLSGNGPLVDVFRSALTDDEAKRKKVPKKEVARKVNAFIQPIHVWRDEYVKDKKSPADHIVVFDEAQRAWTREKASDFMRRKKQVYDFDMSEPEFLLKVMDRHSDWCTVICLVGGGQEINTGEAGISEWISALNNKFPDWQVFISDKIHDRVYNLSKDLTNNGEYPNIRIVSKLHLNISMRSFRAETVSDFISILLDGDIEEAHKVYREISEKYEIVLTRDISIARAWLKGKARGLERYGLVASSGAKRLKPEGLLVQSGRNGLEAANWFLNDKADVRSSFAMEDVATEFDVQGLELDWVGVCWDADFRRENGAWTFQNFTGTSWKSIKSEIEKNYLRNAYRVILTRARQGIVIFLPNGSKDDCTRKPEFYNETYEYLKNCGIKEIAAKNVKENDAKGSVKSLF